MLNFCRKMLRTTKSKSSKKETNKNPLLSLQRMSNVKMGIHISCSWFSIYSKGETLRGPHDLHIKKRDLSKIKNSWVFELPFGGKMNEMLNL